MQGILAVGRWSLSRLSGKLRAAVAIGAAIFLGIVAGGAHAEGSRSLYPPTYNAAGFRAELDVSSPTTFYAGVVKRVAFFYVYAQAGEYIELGSRNRAAANGGDIIVYNPQSFGTPANETFPANADFSCISGTTRPGTHFFGGTRGIIPSRAAELAGPNSANNAVTVTNGFAPCAYQAQTTGIYGVRFTAATNGGAAASGSVATPNIGNTTVSAWDITVRAGVTSTADLNARLFTYAFVGVTGGNSRPLYSLLYYVTQDGYRYAQTLHGLDPASFALYANLLGFLDSGEPLYKDIRGNSALVNNFPPNVVAQRPQYPVFFSDVTPGNANSPGVTLVFQSLGIPENPPQAEVSGIAFAGNAGPGASTVGAGGNFEFSTRNTFTYQIVISRDGIDFDPANPQNRLLNGVALSGSHAIYWNGLDNGANVFPAGSYQFKLSGRNGEIHFPLIDAEANQTGGPTITGLNGTANSIVYFDDRGYVTRSGTAVGTLNGFLCGAATPTPPSPDHSLVGVDSNAVTAGKYYRNWPGTGNTNTDCNTGSAFGDTKGLDLWGAQSTVAFQQPLTISAAPATPDVGTSVTATSMAFPGQTVYGSFVFRDDGNVNATGVTYAATIGAPGEYPASVAFTLLPAGVTASYNPANGVVTLTGMPTTLTPNQALTFNFNYPAPTPGNVPVTTTIAAANEVPTPGVSPNTATANTTIQIADLAPTVNVPATAPGGSVVDGTAVFANLASATGPADNVVYSLVIGAAGSHPATVTFSTLPPGVSASYDAGTGIVTLAGMPTSLAPGDALTIGFEYSGPASGSVPVTAGMTTPTLETTTANNTASATTVFLGADLSITKTGPASVVAGASISYTIVVGNAGPSAADGATFSDPLPNGIGNVTATCVGAGGATCGAVDVAGATVSSAITTLPSGGSVTFTINGVAPVDDATLDNTATVAAPSGTTDPNTANNSANATTTVSAAADLGVTKSGPASIAPGQSATYTITVSNAGPSTATAVQLADPTPNGLTLVSASAPCNNTFPCNLGDLASGASVAITAVFSVPPGYAGGTINNVATASSTVADPNPANNSDSASTTIAASADLAAVKTGPATVTAGASISYTVVVSNAGPSDANGAVFSDPLPSGIVSANATCGAPSGAAACGPVNVAGSSVTSTITTLPNGGSVTFTITGTAPAVATTLQNVASIAAPAGVSDPNGANNAGTASTTVNASADLSLVKTGPASVASGAAISYSVVVANAGPSAADGATYADTVPAGITDVTATCAGASGGAVCANPNVAGNAVTGALPTLPAGSAVTIAISGTAPIGAQTIVNNANVTAPAGVTDPNAGNNQGSANTDVSPAADIAVTKTVDNAAPNVGDTVVFTIAATNNGPNDASGVALTDALPSGLSLLSATPAQGTYDAATGVWTLGALANGASASLTISASVDVPGALTNTVQVSASDQTDPDTSSNTAGAALNANASADIRIAKTVDNATPNVGTSVTFTLTVSNAGPNDATGIEVSDPLPAALSFVDATPSQGSFDAGSGVWMVGALTNGASATLTIGASVDAAGSITNVATISHEDQFDPASGNNQSGATVNGQQADIAVSKTVDDATPNVGANVTFTVSAHNNGPSDASGVVVNDALPAGLSFVSASPSQGTYDAATGAWTVGALGAAGATSSATLTIVASVAAAGPLANVATLTAIDQTDPNSTNDTASASLNGNPQADLGVSKSGPATVTPGDTIAYTIVVSNVGPSDATAVVVDDATPAGLTFVANSGACATAYPCNVGTIAAGASATITSTYTVPADYAGADPIINTASVNSATPDPNTTNDQGSADTGVGLGNADLGIAKAGPASVDSNGAIRYTLTISNAGPSPANGATYDDPLPAGLTAISASCGGESGGATCGTQPVVAGTDVSGQVGALPSGGSVVVTIDATAPAGPQTLTNLATVAAPANVTDGNAGNDQSSVATAVGAPSADLAIVKTGPASATPGQTIAFTLELTNNGPGDASAIEITDATPVGLTFVSASAPCAGGFPCAFGDLATGASTLLTVTYAIPADYAGGAIVNVASLSSPTADPDGNNNIGTVSVPVASADLTIIKNGPSNVAPGAAITYTLLITNLGPAAADGATYDDPVPAEISNVSATCGDETGGAVCAAPVVNGNDVAGAIPTLPMNGAVTVTITGTAPATETLLNNTATATLPAGLTDPTPANNSSTVGTTTPVTLLEFRVD